uniref:Predicted nucleic acid-binding protein, contains PIN domain n=1 Tax=Candidatus Kentrum sp. DK TaxID=2126562 RepID=A0A450SXE1_9GAMM|nr:MAG: Predicted nucleic acid-binding protein, contains PIN domain [Candidatus Kentron sp. DK]VFJ59820.1 MAG: Predicted nucleic acid-binding protein, contains PIN domain [Candidatus Kentron sp. DK]
MQYLLDTVTIVRHFSGHGKIGRKAADILDVVEVRSDLLLISVISLMEILYLSEKNRISIDLPKTLEWIESSPKYAMVDLNADILRVARTISFGELHDRLILATAKWLDVPILSSDGAFKDVRGITVIWE